MKLEQRTRVCQTNGGSHFLHHELDSQKQLLAFWDNEILPKTEQSQSYAFTEFSQLQPVPLHDELININEVALPSWHH
jgi:hypothetical protein